MTDSLGKCLLEANVEKVIRQVQSENPKKQLVSILPEYQSHKKNGEGMKSVPKKPQRHRSPGGKTHRETLVIVRYAQDSGDRSHLVTKW